MILLLKNTGLYFIGGVVGRLGSFLLLPLYTGYLSTESFGVLELIYTTIAILSILFGTGLAHTTLRFYFDFDDQIDRYKVITTGLVLGFIFPLAGSLIVGLNAQQLSILLFDSDIYTKLIHLALIIIFFEISIEVLFAYIRARQKAFVYVISSLAKLFAQISISIYLVAYKNLGIEGIIISNLISIIVIWIILFFYVARDTGLTPDFKLAPPMFKYLLPFAFSSLIAILFINVDKILIKSFLGLADLGIYALAMKFALLLSFLIMQPFQKSYGPYRFEIMKLSISHTIYSGINVFIITISAMIILGISYYVGLVISLMAPPEYHTSAQYVPILLIGVLFQAMSYNFQTGILISKKTSVLSKISFLVLLITVVLNLLLIPRFGLYGASFAYALSNFGVMGLTLYYSQKLHQIRYEYKPIFVNLTLLFVMVLIGLLIENTFPYFMSLTIKLLLFIGFIAVMYFINKPLIMYLHKNIKSSLSQ